MTEASARDLFEQLRLGSEVRNHVATAHVSAQIATRPAADDAAAQLEQRRRLAELLWASAEREFVARMQDAPPMQMRELLRGAIHEKAKIEKQCLEGVHPAMPNGVGPVRLQPKLGPRPASRGMSNDLRRAVAKRYGVPWLQASTLESFYRISFERAAQELRRFAAGASRYVDVHQACRFCDPDPDPAVTPDTFPLRPKTVSTDLPYVSPELRAFYDRAQHWSLGLRLPEALRPKAPPPKPAPTPKPAPARLNAASAQKPRPMTMAKPNLVPPAPTIEADVKARLFKKLLVKVRSIYGKDVDVDKNPFGAIGVAWAQGHITVVPAAVDATIVRARCINQEVQCTWEHLGSVILGMLEHKPVNEVMLWVQRGNELSMASKQRTAGPSREVQEAAAAAMRATQAAAAAAPAPVPAPSPAPSTAAAGRTTPPLGAPAAVLAPGDPRTPHKAAKRRFDEAPPPPLPEPPGPSTAPLRPEPPRHVQAREQLREPIPSVEEEAREKLALREMVKRGEADAGMVGRLEFLDLRERGCEGLELLAGLVVFQALNRAECWMPQPALGWILEGASVQDVVCFIDHMIHELAETGALMEADVLCFEAMISVCSPRPHLMISEFITFVELLPNWTDSERRELRALQGKMYQVATGQVAEVLDDEDGDDSDDDSDDRDDGARGGRPLESTWL